MSAHWESLLQPAKKTLVLPRNYRRTSKEPPTSKVYRVLSKTLEDIRSELRRINCSEFAVSYDRKAKQPEVVLYFVLRDRLHVILGARWARQSDNATCVLNAITALRNLLSCNLGYPKPAAILSPFQDAPFSNSGRSCWDVLGLDATSDTDRISKTYKRLAAILHPDAGGTTRAFQELSAAHEEALELAAFLKGTGV